uniref:EGF-like domain-containing protein n=1 Tax=Phytophthora ramorum TaxID=164328 RepID=H3GXW7_PHYRM
MRHNILHILVLGFAALASLASAQSSSGSTSATIVAHNSTTPAPGSLYKTQCEICRDTGDCSDASSGAPGHYCHEYKYSFEEEKLACCCSTSSTCSSYDSQYRCTCDPKVGQAFGVYAGVGSLIGLVVSVAIFMAIRRRRMQHHRGGHQPVDFVQQPVFVQNYPQQGYAEGACVQPVYNQRGNGQPAYM